MLIAGYELGDLVQVKWSRDISTPARVVGSKPGFLLDDNGLIPADHVVVATHLPFMVSPPGVRVLPVGTPAYVGFPKRDVTLLRRDPGWDPFALPPTATPKDLRIIEGSRHWRNSSYPGATHVGAYIPSTWYFADTPAWVWEQGWRKAHIVQGISGWVKVRFAGGYRRPGGAKAYRPHEVSPVLCAESQRDLLVNWDDFPVPRQEW